MSEGRQYELIPLTQEQIDAHSRMLARLTLELIDLQIEHREQKLEMLAAERQLALRIKRIARVVRDGVEPAE
jgi:hypothetical protein